MNTETNISIEDVLLNRKYLTNKVKKYGFDNLNHASDCKELVDLLDLYAYVRTGPIDLDSNDGMMANEEIMPVFNKVMLTISKSDESEFKRIGNRLSKSKSKKIQKTEKQQKIDDATLFQLNGFALQLGELKGEKISIGQALKFLLDHAVKTIQFS